LLAERSPEDIAAALARLYRARLPSPEDILDPGQGAGRSRDDRGREKSARPPRGDDRESGPRSKPGKSSPRHGMAEGSVWFRAAIGRRKNAEARWLLPMICRRGGIDKHDIGAIRIMDTTTEFEISKAVAESFAVKVRRPDKEDNIRIEPLADAPQGQAASEKRPHTPRNEGNESDRGARRNEKPREERGPNQHGKTVSENGAGFARESGFEKKKRFQGKPAHAGPPQRANAAPARPAFGKRAKKNRGG
jgi:ATP-dependent RNA helicase DeaD